MGAQNLADSRRLLSAGLYWLCVPGEHADRGFLLLLVDGCLCRGDSALLCRQGRRYVCPESRLVWLGEVAKSISIYENIGDFQRGIVDAKNLLFFLSVGGFFVFLTVRAIENRRTV